MAGILNTSYTYARWLLRRPSFAVGAVLSLALGIGANTAIFTCVNAVLLRPLPVQEPARLATVYTVSSDAPDDLFGLSYLNFRDFRDTNTVFSSLLIFRPVVLRLSGYDHEELVNGEMVSGDYFDTLGVRPVLGRTFRPEEDRTPGTHPVTVLGYGMWQRRFGSDPRVLGRIIRLNGQPFTIIGVAPQGFRGLVMLGSPELWVPTMMHDRVLFGRAASWFRDRDGLILNAVGRLKPGVSRQQAEIAMKTLATQLERAYPAENKGLGITLMPVTQAAIHYSIRNKILLASGVLMALVGALLAVTAANIANLLLARALERRREIAVRLSIGASRGQLAQQLIVEGLVLSFAGGAVGLFVARLLRDYLWALRPPTVPASLDIQLDLRVLGFTVLLCLGTGVLFGLAPILQTLRFDLVPALKDLPGAGNDRGRKVGLRQILVIAQVSLSFVSLVGAGLFLQGLLAAQRINPGFETEKLALVSFDLGPQGYGERAAREFQRQLVERAGKLPGVVAATLAERVMFDFHGHTRVGVNIPGREPTPTKEATMIRINLVGPSYFETVGMKLRYGRGFTSQDREGAPRVIVINATMADRFWPGGSALDKHLRFEDEKDDLTVVGVAETCHFDALGEKDEPYIYLPLLQRYAPAVTLHVRTRGDPANILPSVRRVIRSLDRNLALTSERTVREVLAQSLWSSRTAALLLSCFSLLALLLSATGVYSTAAFSVRNRSRELGIRRALGARPIDLLKMVLLEGGSLVGCGLLLGTLVAGLAMPHLGGLLSAIGRLGPVIFIAAALVLAAVSLAANYFPARRAMTIEIARVLRQD
jgi:predicted permease